MLQIPSRGKIRYLILFLTVVFLIVVPLSINYTEKNISQKTPPSIEKYSKKDKDCLLNVLFGEVYGNDYKEKVALLTYFTKEAKNNNKTFCQEWNTIAAGGAMKYSSNNKKDIIRIKSNHKSDVENHKQFINDFLNGKIKPNEKIKNMTNFLTIDLFKSKKCPIWARKATDYIIIDKTIYIKSDYNIINYNQNYINILLQLKKSKIKKSYS